MITQPPLVPAQHHPSHPLPHPCPHNPVSTQSVVKDYYSTVKFILHLVQISFFKPYLCSTAALPLESCRDKSLRNHFWSHLNNSPVTQSYPQWCPSCPRQLCLTCCHCRCDSAAGDSPDCHLCCRHLHHHTQIQDSEGTRHATSLQRHLPKYPE